MKNRLFLFFVLAAFVLSVALPASTVFAAGKTVTLSEFKHEPGKGWTAIFKIKGDWKAADLKGNTITVGGKTYNLYCNFRDDDHISCTMHHDMGQLIGKPATFNFAGVVSNDVVPPKRICNSWYSDWDFAKGMGMGGMSIGDYESWYSWWHYHNWWSTGTVWYDDGTSLPDPYYYFYLEEYIDLVNATLANGGNGGGDMYYGYYYEYEWFEYLNRNCSEQVYDGGKDGEWHVDEWGGEHGEGEMYCEGDECEVFEEYYYCEGDNCEDVPHEEGEVG